jgi:serine/threonine protein kinase
MIRTDNPPHIDLIDFGLARLFRKPATYLHIPYYKTNSILGTLLFTSIIGQQGYAQSRCDDLESLVYTIVFLARGDLPWSSSAARDDREAVLKMKLSITTEELCDGLPTLFCSFINHIRSLCFSEKPDYEYLHTILEHCSEIGINRPAQSEIIVGFICPPAGSPTEERHKYVPASASNDRV